jgi:hypothetical protein
LQLRLSYFDINFAEKYKICIIYNDLIEIGIRGVNPFLGTASLNPFSLTDEWFKIDVNKERQDVER